MAFPENLWQTVKCNDGIYSIPSSMADDHGIYAAFNKDYVSDNDINSWDGTLDGIYDISSNLKWDEKDEKDGTQVPCFQYFLNDYDFCSMFNCEMVNGLLYDYDNKRIYDPLESEKFLHFLHLIEKMKNEQLIDNSISFLGNLGLNEDDVLKKIQSGKFAIALSSGTINDEFQKDNVVIKTLTPYLFTRLSGSIGISANTNDIDAVVDFLGVFYNDEKYANILLYGVEGKDFKLKNGYVSNMDGSDFDDVYLEKLVLNLFINTYPLKHELFTENRKEEYFSFYNDVKLSPFLGFHPDTEDKKGIQISNDINKLMNTFIDDSADKSIERVKEDLKSHGMKSYLNDIKAQWREFQK